MFFISIQTKDFLEGSRFSFQKTFGFNTKWLEELRRSLIKFVNILFNAIYLYKPLFLLFCEEPRPIVKKNITSVFWWCGSSNLRSRVIAKKSQTYFFTSALSYVPRVESERWKGKKAKNSRQFSLRTKIDGDGEKVEYVRVELWTISSNKRYLKLQPII